MQVGYSLLCGEESSRCACHVRQSGKDSQIWRVRRHPLTVSGAQSAFEGSKHRHAPKKEGQSNRDGPPSGS
jgi:hypothetical protein